MELIKFLIIYSFLTMSIIGYGFIFSKYFTKYNKFHLSDLSIGYLGLFGIFFLVLISYLTNLFVSHGNIHNLIIHFIGIFSFFYFFKKKNYKNNIKYFYLAYLISLFSIFYFKNHDDFSYYHLSFIENITRNKIEFGLGHFDVAFNHLSSIFYFHSLFKTIFTSHYFYQIGQLSIVIFVNSILFEYIFDKKKDYKIDVVFYLNLFCIFFINIFFYRLAEHGTDRSAQILFFLCVIIIISLFKNKKNLDSIFEKLIIIFTLIVSIKSFYLLYSLLLIAVYLNFYKINYTFNFFQKHKIIFPCLAVFLLTLLYNFSHSGCFIYPVYATCPNNVFWGYDKEQILGFMNWYELWSKAGATPNYRVDNPEFYLTNLNWVPNWLDNYFFNKVSDFILGIIFMFLIVFLFFRPKKISFKNASKLNFIYLSLIILFVEWFYNHPTLRYGGYVLLFLLFSIPIAVLLENQKFKYASKIKPIKIIFIISLVIFAGRNIDRLLNEYQIYKYKFYEKPYYRIQKSFFNMQNKKLKIFDNKNYCEKKIKNHNLNCKNIKNFKFYYNNKN